MHDPCTEKSRYGLPELAYWPFFSDNNVDPFFDWERTAFRLVDSKCENGSAKTVQLLYCSCNGHEKYIEVKIENGIMRFSNNYPKFEYEVEYEEGSWYILETIAGFNYTLLVYNPNHDEQPRPLAILPLWNYPFFILFSATCQLEYMFKCEILLNSTINPIQRVDLAYEREGEVQTEILGGFDMHIVHDDTLTMFDIAFENSNTDEIVKFEFYLYNHADANSDYLMWKTDREGGYDTGADLFLEENHFDFEFCLYPLSLHQYYENGTVKQVYVHSGSSEHNYHIVEFAIAQQGDYTPVIRLDNYRSTRCSEYT
ncbi:hypothetical protein CAPTEDRAFT_191059 [Capitella teleta]|uniref:Uncharacterized protein n=1 Tax=Capitella teleta TaxID=283909 RepID=R7UWR9_CAPTE|nr:hypothetical protein CAPTEDRAFT_191058 [Capitella teleta]ELU10693.1 hypothetical protein CAPTEDRAFT_191059 [Capitella teleta]|eukprot:ELU10692.1 hypothetical protein CAPTEDRAFT_191058 [Capitella teleta]